ncbi:ADL193Cp [Eremothecium gossypii ATCC 10895]|uniref:ADL193Cp n=1 Tax=Eremothecium gossypii (strain ATCC 10895 / CBS 109.51 / FGSC 9923 / NRRL Y-1056) TaxID=284811 RepID=Q75AW3_EREGS|nr:ADL193Cp [Eremothecium gossypii ATCC 10895]AAS51727.2 ADL193Cp [Eremothecium gossypii ATCC 10895]AEY96024.1 FADL193Cp [Eremothecium gossypii FDAG1]
MNVQEDESTDFEDDSRTESVQMYLGEYPENAEREGSGEMLGGKLARLKTRFMSPRVYLARKRLLVLFLSNMLFLACLVLVVFSLHVGVLVNQQQYLGRLPMLMVVQDEDAGMSAELLRAAEHAAGRWTTVHGAAAWSHFGLEEDADLDEYLQSLIRKHRYWMALHVRPGATEALRRSLDDPGAPVFNSSEFFKVYYETVRDFNAMGSVRKLMETLEANFRAYYLDTWLPGELRERANTIDLSSTGSNIVAAGSMRWSYVDLGPFYDPSLYGILQVGMIICLLLTFFQLAMISALHTELSLLLRTSHLLLYRYIVSYASYLLLSLFYSIVPIIYHLDMEKAYGRAGFLVFWMTTWLFMTALGGANENVISVIFEYCPRFVGFWLMFWIVFNITPTFYSLHLANDFYKYGYITPIYNARECYKVLLFDTDRGYLKVAYVVLVAWTVLNAALFPLALKIVNIKSGKQK